MPRPAWMTRGSESIGSSDGISHNARLMRLRKTFVSLSPPRSVCFPYCSGYKRGSGQWGMQRSAESTCGLQRGAEARRRRAHLALDCLCVYVCTPAQEQAAKQATNGWQKGPAEPIRRAWFDGLSENWGFSSPPSVLSLSVTPYLMISRGRE